MLCGAQSLGLNSPSRRRWASHVTCAAEDHSRALKRPEAKAETWDFLQVHRKARRAGAKSLTGVVFTEMVPVNLHQRDLLLNKVSCHRGSVALAVGSLSGVQK